MERKEKIEGCLYGGTAGNAMYAVLMLDSASAIIPGRDAGNMSCHGTDNPRTYLYKEVHKESKITHTPP